MTDKQIDRLLKQACLSTSACWAVVLVPAAEGWAVRQACRIGKRARELLMSTLSGYEIHAWLSGALTIGRSRSRKLQSWDDSRCERFYVFPRKESGDLVLVGAPTLTAKQQKHWRDALSKLGSLPSAQSSAPEPAGLATAHLLFLKKALREISVLSDVDRAGAHISHLLAEHFSCSGVAISAARSGESLVNSAYGKFDPALSALIKRMGERGKSRLVAPKNALAAGTTQAVMCAPLDPSDPAAGLIFLARSGAPFTKSDLLILELMAAMLAGVIANAYQYQSLQNTVLALQEAQLELQARIGAQKEAEARLVQAAKLAAVGEMAAGVAHELNNPLTTVVGFTELVMDEMPDDLPQKNDLDMVLREARRARTVVRRLLDFARQSETSRASADLNELVADVVALMRHLLHTSGVELRLDLQESLPWTVMDRNQIKQVILNLVHNALNATPKGSGVITIATRQRALYHQSWLALSVKDNGVGIPADHIEHIFEPFFTTRSSAGGTGLGLSVTYGIVTDHGGRIEVESQPQLGSEFIVWLPLNE